MEKINLYVDDLRQCPEGFLVARTYKEAVQYLTGSQIHILSLDHDLGGEKTGYDLVKLICEKNINIDEIYLHTDNPVGRENMLQTLLAAQRRGIINIKTKIYRYAIN